MQGIVYFLHVEVVMTDLPTIPGPVKTKLVVQRKYVRTYPGVFI